MGLFLWFSNTVNWCYDHYQKDFRRIIQARLIFWLLLWHSNNVGWGAWILKLLFNSSWDEELAEVAQIWADQCANVIYFHNSDMYPRIFHERGFERTTSRFHSPPGVGQNVAWALTKHVNFTRIIDDLWYRDINKLKPGRIGDFQVRTNHKLLNNGIFSFKSFFAVLFKIFFILKKSLWY